jgi:hypothetical protein
VHTWVCWTWLLAWPLLIRSKVGTLHAGFSHSNLISVGIDICSHLSTKFELARLSSKMLVPFGPDQFFSARPDMHSDRRPFSYSSARFKFRKWIRSEVNNLRAATVFLGSTRCSLWWTFVPPRQSTIVQHPRLSHQNVLALGQGRFFPGQPDVCWDGYIRSPTHPPNFSFPGWSH